MLKELCGKENFKNVVVLTTFWDLAGSEGQEIDDHLKKSRFFKDLVAGDACFMSHNPSTRDSALQVLRHISGLEPNDARIAKEMIEEGRSLERTSAGRRI